ncbi:unnamed protein product [Cylicostephanus goldi]|uniref:Uncharacterized protein n=1 Tax=Cylicostephanus goldi TaxID=71465 RepID=A0A3P7N2P2_CYLGO|nr:unnamed protein product [Cylicostephanus goldi]
MSTALEDEYVHSVYSRLAAYQKKDHRPSSPRVWPKVRGFLESQAYGSIVIDVGCGEAKYTSSKTIVLGIDTCADALIGRRKNGTESLDLLLGDALALPFRQLIQKRAFGRLHFSVAMMCAFLFLAGMQI